MWNKTLPAQKPPFFFLIVTTLPLLKVNHHLDFYYCRLDSPVFHLYVNEMTQHVFLYVWLLSFNIVSVRSIYAVSCGSWFISLLYGIHYTVDRLHNCFQFGAFMDVASINILVCIFCWKYVFLLSNLRSPTARS